MLQYTALFAVNLDFNCNTHQLVKKKKIFLYYFHLTLLVLTLNTPFYLTLPPFVSATPHSLSLKHFTSSFTLFTSLGTIFVHLRPFSGPPTLTASGKCGARFKMHPTPNILIQMKRYSVRFFDNDLDNESNLIIYIFKY